MSFLHANNRISGLAKILSVKPESVFPLLLIAPSVIIVFGLVLYPAISTLYISLFQMGPLFPRTVFIGLDNYASIASSSAFRQSIIVTSYFVGLSLVITVVFGLLIAILLNQEFVGRGFVRAAVIVPWAVPEVVNGMMWLWIYDPNYGVLNGILEQLGIIDRYIDWLGSPFLALNMLVIADSWKELPLYVLIFLAALQTIPRDLYEQVRVDGGGAFRAFWHITLPLLMTTIFVVLALRTIFSFRTFAIVYVLTGGGPADGTKIIGFHIYQETFGFLQFGRGAAMSITLTLMVAAIVVIYFLVLGRRRVEM